MVLVALVEVKITSVVVGSLLGKQVMDRRQDPVGYGIAARLYPRLRR
jgi:hypothetical protein